MNIRENEWRAIKEWLNDSQSIENESRANRHVLLENRVRWYSKRVFIAFTRDHHTGQLTLSLRRIGLLERLVRAIFGKYSRYANTILLPDPRKKLIELIKIPSVENRPHYSLQQQSRLSREEATHLSRTTFATFASEDLLLKTHDALLGFIHDKGNTPNGRLFLATRMVYMYVGGTKRNVKQKPLFLNQDTWNEILNVRRHMRLLTAEESNRLNSMLSDTQALILFGEDKTLSHIQDEEFAEKTRTVFFALKQIGKRECQAGDFRIHLDHILPGLTLQRIQECGGEEKINREYQNEAHMQRLLIQWSKQEREYAVGDEAEWGFVPWVDEDILPNDLQPEIFDFLIRESHNEAAQLFIMMRIIHYNVFGNGRRLPVRPIDQSRKQWKAIVQLRAKYGEHPLGIRQHMLLDDLMKGRQLMLLCQEGEAARILEENLEEPLREAFLDLKQVSTHSLNTYQNQVNRILGAAPARKVGRSCR